MDHCFSGALRVAPVQAGGSHYFVKLNCLARHRFAIIALAVIALGSSAWQLLDLVGALNRGVDFGVPAFESRFDQFRPTIKPHAVYGYFSDNPPNDPSYLSEYYLTQYTLVPAIIMQDTNEELVVMNLHSERPDQAAMRAANLVPVQIFGHGVLLCRHLNQ